MRTSQFTASFLGLMIAAVSAVEVKAAEEAGNCTAAKRLISAASTFYSARPELIDQINPLLNVGIKGVNGHPDPTHLLYRFEEFEHAMPGRPVQC